MPVPVILDGAQGAGAVPVDVEALGCVAYAAAGQKWLCGADGTGMLWLDPEFGERVRTIAPGYAAFDDASRGLESTLRAGGRRFDAALSREAVAFSLAALEVARRRRPGRARWSAPPTSPTVRDRARRRRATRSPSAGAARSSRSSTPTRPRRASGWRRPASPCATCPATRTSALSVGAWNDESDLERLLAALK